MQEGSPYQVRGSKLTISFPKEAAFHKESLEQKESLNLMIKLWDEYQTKKNDIEALNAWKGGLSEAQKEILELLIKITPEKK